MLKPSISNETALRSNDVETLDICGPRALHNSCIVIPGKAALKFEFTACPTLARALLGEHAHSVSMTP